jgi:hypothetical protein
VHKKASATSEKQAKMFYKCEFLLPFISFSTTTVAPSMWIT